MPSCPQQLPVQITTKRAKTRRADRQGLLGKLRLPLTSLGDVSDAGA